MLLLLGFVLDFEDCPFELFIGEPESYVPHDEALKIFFEELKVVNVVMFQCMFVSLGLVVDFEDRLLELFIDEPEADVPHDEALKIFFEELKDVNVVMFQCMCISWLVALAAVVGCRL